MKKMNNKGFSLVELIVVIAIMAVLMGVLAPTLLGNVEKSKFRKDQSTCDTLYTAFTNAAGDPDCSSDMTGKIYSFTITSGDVTIPSSGSSLGGQTVTDDVVKKVSEYVGTGTLTFSSKYFKGSGTVLVAVTESGKVAIYATGSDTSKANGKFYINCKDDAAWTAVTQTLTKASGTTTPAAGASGTTTPAAGGEGKSGE